MLPRDLFIDALFAAAQKDKDIYFLCADLGAKALDRFRAELPQQFIHVGICEQNMIDVAAGLAQNGKKVFAYAMASFITLRCLEQIKVALALTNQPVTLLGVGPGYGYDDAGPTHYALEDISCFRSLPNMHVLSPIDGPSLQQALELCLNKPALRYLRLERKGGPTLYDQNLLAQTAQGLVALTAGKGIALITHGHMHERAQEIRAHYEKQGMDLAIIDAFCLSPLDAEKVRPLLARYDYFITLEEHFLRGGLGSAILETLSDLELAPKVLRLGIPDQYFFENGGRKKMHELSFLDLASCLSKIDLFLKKYL